MLSWRVLGTLGCLLLTVAHARAQSVTLAETVAADECFQYVLDMKLTGTISFKQGESNVSLNMEAAGSHELRERILVIGPTGIPEKAARLYDKAEAVIVVNKDRVEKKLRPERKLIVAQRQREGLLAYCPTGPLTKAELDVTSDHFDVLSVVGLLPGKAVAVGDTWKIGNVTVQGLCSFEGLIEHTLAGKLESVKDDRATFTVTGTANGIDMGVQAKMTIQARGVFDLKGKRLIELEWKQQDQRDRGPVSPEMNVTATTVMKRTPIAEPKDLTMAALVVVPDPYKKDTLPPERLTQVEFHDLKGRFDLLLARQWQITSQGETRTVMRLMEAGEFIAQVTITPWENAGKGKHMTPQEFNTKMNDTPGWVLKQQLQDDKVPSETSGRWIHRLSMLGTLDGVDVLQNFYLVAGPDGDQVVLAFTMTPKQVDKLRDRDLSLVTSLEVPSPKK